MQMQSRNKTFIVALAAASIAALGTTKSAQATVLEQKWQAGQTLSYDMAVNGVLNVNADDAAPFAWAGLPLDIKVNGGGQISLNTVSVNAAGSGTVKVGLPRLNLQGTTFGMSAGVDIKNGVAKMLLNGQAGKTFDASALANPTYALTFSRLGKFEGVVPMLAPTATSTGTQNSPAPTAPTAAMIQKLASVLPQLWPGTDVKPGESWTVEPLLPTGDAPNAPVLKVGKLTLKLVGEESVAGKTLQRISLNGVFALDNQTLSLLNSSPGAQGAWFQSSQCQ
jgi:hypothetical protein